MKEAQNVVSQSLGVPLSGGYIATLHEHATRHRDVKPAFRDEKSGNSNDGRIGIGLLPEHVEGQGRKEMENEKDQPMRYSGFDDETGEHRLSTKRMDSKEIKLLLDSAISQFNKTMVKARSKELILDAVARLSQSIARLHPFTDANTRTNMLLLNKLLVENGMPAAIIRDPKHFYLNSLKSWKLKILDGMNTWCKFANDVALMPQIQEGKEELEKKENFEKIAEDTWSYARDVLKAKDSSDFEEEAFDGFRAIDFRETGVTEDNWEAVRKYILDNYKKEEEDMT